MKKLIFYTLLIFILLSIPTFLFRGEIHEQNVRLFVMSFGLLAPITYIFLAAFTNIIPPLAATPLWLASVILFGPIQGFIFSFTANLIGSSICFYIARIWGKRAVLLVSGKKALKELESLPSLSTKERVFALKLVGGALTDYLSYGAGLTKIAFRDYFIATFFGSLPMILFGFLVIKGVSINSTTYTNLKALGIFYTVNYLSSLLLIPLGVYFAKKNK